MTTCRDIIKASMREIKALSGGEEPAADEAADALDTLQAIIEGLYGFGLGEELAGVEIDADATLTPNSRAIVTSPSALTLTMPEAPDNGARIQIIDLGGNLSTFNLTLARNGRKMEGAASDLTLSTDSIDRTWMYRGDTASWERVSDLTLDSDLPFPEREWFTLELALRLIPTFGGALSPESQVTHKRSWNRLKARFRQRVVVPADDAVRALSRQPYRPGVEL